MSKLRAVFAISLLLVGAILYFGIFHRGKGGPKVEVTVETGMTAHAVLDQLLEKGLIKSRIPFLVWVRIRKVDSKIKVGRYHIAQGQSAYWIVDDFIRGRTEKLKIVVPEGFASWQIAGRLESFGFCSSAEFMQTVQEKNMEGFLFPATYEFEYGLSADDVTRRMRKEFDRRWLPEFTERAASLGWSQKDTVTFASVIEREVRVREELPMISAVYHNRLKKKMRLEADPTVQYALGFWKERLTYDDYQNTRSPYNTYLNSGLPPGPICSPGIDSIRAALWPVESEALFLLAQGDGRHTFSRTYRDHTNKVNSRNRIKKKNMIKRKP